MWRIYVGTPDEMIATIAEFDTDEQATEALPEDTQDCEYWIEYAGNHQRKRRMAEHDSVYVGKHECLSEIFAEVSAIFAEVAEALELTEEFVAEVTAPARKIAEKVTARVQKTLAERIHMPEFRPVRNIFPVGKAVIPCAGIC